MSFKKITSYFIFSITPRLIHNLVMYRGAELFGTVFLLFFIETVQEPLFRKQYFSLSVHECFVRSTVAADIHRLVSAVGIFSKHRSHLFAATWARQVLKSFIFLYFTVESNHSFLFRFFLYPMMLLHFEHINKSVERLNKRR